jgi:dinuclear metal center YbgI/SA1388 family protein
VATRDEIISFCDELLDIDSFADYGPNGLQVPGADTVELIATGVTANRDFLAAAVEAGAGLAIVHHGLFFGDGSRALTPQLAERLRIVLAAGTSLAGYHLPLDAHREIGNNALICAKLGLEQDGRPFAAVKGQPIGVIGRAPQPLSAAALAGRVGELLGREPLLFDDGPAEIETVGIVSGGGASTIEEAVALGLDAFLTGEPAEHVMGDAREGGLHFIAAGHYATETFGVRRLGELAAGRFGVEHRFIDIPNPI